MGVVVCFVVMATAAAGSLLYYGEASSIY